MASAISIAPKYCETLSNKEQKVLKELKTDESIKVVPADKGNATVIINTNEYEYKVTNHLNDEQTYKRLEVDPSANL